MMASYQERLIDADTQLTTRILELRSVLSQVERQRNEPLQDDWDDALMVAAYQIDEAEYHVQRALAALKEGT